MTTKFDNQSWYSISEYLKDKFGSKIVKLALDGNFTCPNRDGKKGFGGCTFCSESGSGEFSSNDMQKQISLLKNKWPVSKYIAYFQSHTNTYADVNYLRELYDKALRSPNIVGIAIATRPDCLPDDVLSLLDEYNKKTFLWVELGLQTMHDKTAKEINRCYELSEYDRAVFELKKRNIRVVTHLILGLPGENKEMIFNSVKYVCKDDIFGIKLHLLNLVKSSPLALKNPDYVSFNSLDEYVTLVCDLLEIIPENITIHRLTADTKRSLLISPEWSYKKRTILNSIENTLRSRDSYQGKFAHFSDFNLPSL